MIKTLFYSTYYAYLRGNFQSTAMYYALLKQEFLEGGKPDSLLPHQFKILKSVRNALKNKEIPTASWVDIEMGANVPHGDEYDDQKVLAREIHRQLPVLANLLQAKGSLHLQNLEHPCPPYGFVDMLYRDDWYEYPIELKIGSGKHDVISQILKYDLFFKLQLHLGFYQEVQPVVVCSHFQDYTFTELKKHGVITLRYEKKDDGLKLFRI